MRNLNLLVVRCANIERSKGFYELFGMAFVKEQHGNGPAQQAIERRNFTGKTPAFRHGDIRRIPPQGGKCLHFAQNRDTIVAW